MLWWVSTVTSYVMLLVIYYLIILPCFVYFFLYMLTPINTHTELWGYWWLVTGLVIIGLSIAIRYISFPECVLCNHTYPPLLLHVSFGGWVMVVAESPGWVGRTVLKGFAGEEILVALGVIAYASLYRKLHQHLIQWQCYDE